ncbi:MAG TPA: MBL fold metallo-hydrolase [Gaiellales bacterium]|jgi:glyoxylase-like metal-dependent hydrolase (beta-lactamase superfamily II)|nr:MBL fold metallo-hydrolase [Gaiellales bacterium]
MRQQQERPNLTRLTRLGFVNAYLVSEEDGLTLVDTMIPGSADGILAAAGKLGRPLRRIVLTHGHGDHVGSLDALAERLPEAEIAVSVRESRLLAGDRELEPDEPASKIRGSWPDVSTVPTRLLEPDDRVGSLRVIQAPGHTPGQIALLDERDGTLIAGDAYSTLAGISTGGHTNRRFPLVAMATWDRGTANRTAVALRALDPAALAVGHGPVMLSPAAAMDRALAAVGTARRQAA